MIIGGEMMIQSWNDGVLGMRVGGKRRFTVPPDLAYDSRGVGDIVPANATLIFDVELLAVRDRPT